MTTYWRAVSERLLVRQWEDSAVLLHRDAGSTHFLDGFEALVFFALSAGPASETQLDASLQATVEGTAAEIESAVRRTLRALEHLRLVERCEAAVAP